ncbi:hypothetical protein J3E69DRAFT_290254 [Trichoderma sp. SZMC 28015]
MELAQVCTKVPRYRPVPQQFKGRALEKVKSRRTTKKKKHGPVGLAQAQAQQKPRQTQEAEAASCRRALDPPPPLPSIHTAPIFSHTKPSGPLCCLCGSLPDGEAVLHEQYVYSCRARVNVGGSWTSPQCTPASNPRPRSIDLLYLPTYFHHGAEPLCSLYCHCYSYSRPSILYNSPASPTGGTWRRRRTLSEMPGL